MMKKRKNKHCKKVKEMKRSNYFSVFCAVLLMSVIGGCTKYPAYEITEQFFLDESFLNMYTSDQVQVMASPADGDFVWSIDNESVAKVSQTGLVEAVGPGIAEIIVAKGTARMSLPVVATVKPADDVIIIDGENEGQLQVFVQTLHERVSKVRVYWNNNSDSVDVDVNNRMGFSMQECSDTVGSTVFFAASFDKYGNKSPLVQILKSTLRHRTIISALLQENRVTIQWGDDTPLVQSSILSYVDTKGQNQTLEVAPNETTTVFKNYASGLTLNSVFVESHLQLDPVEVLFTNPPPPKNEWTVEVDNPNNTEGGGVDAMKDANYDNQNNFWHSQGDLPHWAVFDMKMQVAIKKITVHRRSVSGISGNGDTKTVECYVSNTSETNTDKSWRPGPSWTPLGEIVFPEGNVGHTQTLDVNAAGRYILLFIPDSHRSQFISICEVDIE
jgi:hypothetical protein